MSAKVIFPMLLLLTVVAFAQLSKGIRPVKNGTPLPSGVVRAVVVGISSYRHKNIPPLKYAHRDAKANCF